MSVHNSAYFSRVVFVAETLRALYLSDNDFETLPADIGKLVNLQIVSTSLYSKYFSVIGY